MTGKKFPLVLGSLVALLALAGLAFLWLRQAEVAPGSAGGAAARAGEVSPLPPTAPRLEGSWFVRYLSDPNAYLDVAAKAPPGDRIARVTAELSGPDKKYPDLRLKYNTRDREWQIICGFLPAKLVGGVWWVSRVRISTAGGHWTAYSARTPHGTYRVDHGDTAGTRARGGSTRSWIGSFYARSQDASRPLFHVHTVPTQGGAPSNPVLQVYRASDPVRWFAINDDPDVNQDYARLALPLTPGETYYIRVDDRYHKLGHYAVAVTRSAAAPARPARAKAPDASEPDDDHRRARVISLGQVQARSFSRRGGIWGDQDWLKFSVPAR